jgi:predicted MPP superfamily phosphohydrolase
MRQRPAAALVLVLLLALHVYIGWRLLPPLQLGLPGNLVGIALLACSCVLLPLGLLARFMTRQPLADRLAWAGLVTMGLFSSVLIATVLRDLSLGIVWLALPRLAPAWHANSAWIAPLLALLVTAVGFINARRRARIIDVEIPAVGLPPQLDGFTIAQISDIHVGPTIKSDYLQAIVDAVNTMSVDLVAVTGDLVDGSVAELQAHTAPLRQLRARHGTFFVTGNHEYYSGVDEWVAELARLDVQVLLNEHRVLRHDGASLLIAGVTDFNAAGFDAAHRSDPQAALANAPQDIAFKLLLAHQPRSAGAAAAAGFDLQLSGHTHGGQFWPWNHFVRFQQPYTSGLHRLADLWIYISRGTGYWGPPKRFGAPSEITRITLRRVD